MAVSIYGPIAGRRGCAQRGDAGAWAIAPKPRPGASTRRCPDTVATAGRTRPELATRLIRRRRSGLADRRSGDRIGVSTAHLPQPLVVLHPGAAHGEAKRWPDEHWTALARDLEPDVGALAVIGLADARPTAAEIAEAVNIHDLTDRTSLDELVGVLARADVVVSTDSGPGHLARALGRRVVMLHGPTDIAIHGPWRSCIASPACRPALRPLLQLRPPGRVPLRRRAVHALALAAARARRSPGTASLTTSP